MWERELFTFAWLQNKGNIYKVYSIIERVDRILRELDTSAKQYFGLQIILLAFSFVCIEK